MKTLALHVGMPKCGSTTIQNMSQKYSEVLEKHGVLYPDFPFFSDSIKNKSLISTGNANHLVYALNKELGQNIGGISWGTEEVNALIEQRFIESKATIMMLSHESLVAVLRPLGFFCQHWRAKDFRVVIVFYLRDQISWLASDYQQHVRQMRSSRGIADHVAERLPYVNYAPICKRFEEMVGRENLIVKVMSDESMRSNMLFDCYANLGVDIPEFSTLNVVHSNVGLNHVAVQVLASINSQKINEADYQRIFKVLSNVSFGGKGTYLIPQSIRQYIFSTCLEWNKSLSQYLLTQSDVTALNDSMRRGLELKDEVPTAADISKLLLGLIKKCAEERSEKKRETLDELNL